MTFSKTLSFSKKNPFQLIGVLLALFGLIFVMAGFITHLLQAFEVNHFKVKQGSGIDFMIFGGLPLLVLGLVIYIGGLMLNKD
jgi:hypothetical protein